MTFSDSINVCLFKKYADFSGRASRSEFWWFTLFNALGIFAVIVLSGAIGYIIGGLFTVFSAIPIGSIIYSLAVVVPSIAVVVRRLHDTGRSGWWYFIVFVPIVGSIVLLVMMCLESADENEYGLPMY